MKLSRFDGMKWDELVSFMTLQEIYKEFEGDDIREGKVKEQCGMMRTAYLYDKDYQDCLFV